MLAKRSSILNCRSVQRRDKRVLCKTCMEVTPLKVPRPINFKPPFDTSSIVKQLATKEQKNLIRLYQNPTPSFVKIKMPELYLVHKSKKLNAPKAVRFRSSYSILPPSKIVFFSKSKPLPIDYKPKSILKVKVHNDGFRVDKVKRNIRPMKSQLLSKSTLKSLCDYRTKLAIESCETPVKRNALKKVNSTTNFRKIEEQHSKTVIPENRTDLHKTPPIIIPKLNKYLKAQCWENKLTDIRPSFSFSGLPLRRKTTQSLPMYSSGNGDSINCVDSIKQERFCALEHNNPKTIALNAFSKCEGTKEGIVHVSRKVLEKKVASTRISLPEKLFASTKPNDQE
ncbi:uncharacterized protein LOC119682546 [Teleopsis dalmanni]|uniref:uncharacterized protein LOC119682546 n=1 Tax=Teleopsis dalmanni TaxID=139649 RepID=UPI0018CFC222|nr:uncharacterized protein LOC119682546 [Teleopsis dalmanni]